ncbi:hypothetical protein ACFPL7_05740 [Dongia soli]|uniref:Transglycosylase SLT domain-containing protein n=1 Tax=Dongia soli TaxID=600628 RepID=A0ABU5EFB0_9PROT|nr:hypothetical protein [Dongia soli]MDY0884903.1 hypothetical protein [Dongia soli]
MEPQISPSKSDTRAVPSANPGLPVNNDANISGVIPTEGAGATRDQTEITRATEAKQLGDRFGLNYDLVLRNLDQLRQAAALEDVTFGEFRLPFGIGESNEKEEGNPVATSRSLSNVNAQAAGASPQPDLGAQEKRSNANHKIKLDNETTMPVDDSDAVRKAFILKGGGGHFVVKENPNASSETPWYALASYSDVKKYQSQIDYAADKVGVDPRLIRAIMYVETTHGYYDRFNPRPQTNKSILPMNVNVKYWDDHFGTREQLNDPLQNVLAGAKMIKAIVNNVPKDTSIAAIATLYNSHVARTVSSYGAQVAKAYETQPWQQDLIRDRTSYQFRRGGIPPRQN